MKRHSPQETLSLFLSSAAYHTENIINNSSDGDTYRWVYPFFSIRETGPNIYKVCKIDLCKTFDIAISYACPGWGYPNMFVGGVINVFISDIRFNIELNGVCDHFIHLISQKEYLIYLTKMIISSVNSLII